MRIAAACFLSKQSQGLVQPDAKFIGKRVSRSVQQHNRLCAPVKFQQRAGGKGVGCFLQGVNLDPAPGKTQHQFGSGTLHMRRAQAGQEVKHVLFALGARKRQPFLKGFTTARGHILQQHAAIARGCQDGRR